jgi:hypothetical protein
MDPTSPSRFPNELDVLAEFLAVLDSLNIPYALGGSMAGSVYGKVRFTRMPISRLNPSPSQWMRWLSDLVRPFM